MSLKLVETESILNALADVSLEIMAERDKTEREIRDLLVKGEDQKALRLLRRYWGVPPRLKVAK